ncbi:formylglycine-generating enzyme family protein [Sorangium sp. So ce1151]|uniref:formylglycine-generating enzyme family protein n=1 Tax=Sorangium sp. So ce1151 TaxID=3133332 RepID=UPI003F62363D
MSHPIVHAARASISAGVMRTAGLQLGLLALLAGCAPKGRDFQGIGVGGAGDGGASGIGGHETQDGGAGSGGSAPGDGGASDGGAGGHSAGVCTPDDRQCSENGPQRCNDLGQWEDMGPCPPAAACDSGRCVPPSCVGLTETCGPAHNESCCATAPVPGGMFDRGNDPAYPATVSGFLLDRFEVTVGRFRKFMEAYPGSKPAPRAGAHPLINGSGWDASWDGYLPAYAAALKPAVKCDSIYQTWTDEAADHENLPMNCLNWYVAFAFCAWDGGRLPTEAEWNYAVAGGSEQREYPWSMPAGAEIIDPTYAAYNCTGDGSASGACAFSDIQSVGSRSPKGDGRWGQADLAGNMWEWLLDWYGEYQYECNDCAETANASQRVLRGGSWFNDTPSLLSSWRHNFDQLNYDRHVGVRCARTQ